MIMTGPVLAGAPLVGLTAAGQLFWGSHLVAGQCTSAAIRDRGPGGAFLLWTTRSSFLHCRSFEGLSEPEAPTSLPQHIPDRSVFLLSFFPAWVENPLLHDLSWYMLSSACMSCIYVGMPTHLLDITSQRISSHG